MQAIDQPRKLATQQGYFGTYLDGCQAMSEGAENKSLSLAAKCPASFSKYGWQIRDP